MYCRTRADAGTRGCIEDVIPDGPLCPDLYRLMPSGFAMSTRRSPCVRQVSCSIGIDGLAGATDGARRPGGNMNEDTLKGQWTQLKGKAREQWGKLTGDDLDRVQGQSEQLVGRIQERYGIAKDEAEKQLDGFLGGLGVTERDRPTTP